MKYIYAPPDLKIRQAVRFGLRVCLAGPTLAGLFVLVLFGGGEARAALGPTEPANSVLTQLMLRSSLVERLQQLFAEIRIYDGEIDGRLNDELTTSIRHYQSRTGLAVDGKVSEQLLAHVEFEGRAEALLVRLDIVGKSQRTRARALLESAALTRSLLNPERKKQTADLTRNRDICFQAPTVDCLIFEAIESTKAVGRSHFRDWTYGEISVVQSSLGQVDAARETAGRIQDPRLILISLRNIAMALADSDRLELAAESSAIIPDTWMKAEALASLAVAQTRHGDWPLARQTMQEVKVLIEDSEGQDAVNFKRTSLISGLAQKLMSAGDPTIALELLAAERDRLRDNSAEVSSAALSTLAAAFAEVDQPGAARDLVGEGMELIHQRSVSIALARALGRAGKGAAAIEIANGLKEARYKAILLADIARYQMADEQPTAARNSLIQAEKTVTEIAGDQRFAINHAWEKISGSWMVLGDDKRANLPALRISNAGVKAGLYWRLAHAYEDRRDYGAAEKANALALSSMADVKGALDRVWLYCGQVQALADRKEQHAALQAFKTALDVVRGIRHSWTRAQALVRLVRAFAVLPGLLHLDDIQDSPKK